MSVESSSQNVADWEALVQQLEEVLPQFGGHGGAVGRIEPESLPSSPLCTLVGPCCWLKSEQLLVTRAFQCLLKWPLGSVEKLLGGGEEGQPFLPLPRYLLPYPASYPYNIGERTISYLERKKIEVK